MENVKYVLKGNFYIEDEDNINKLTSFLVYKEYLKKLYKENLDIDIFSYIYSLKTDNKTLDIENKKILNSGPYWYSLNLDINNFKISKDFLNKLKQVQNREEYINFFFVFFFERNKLLNIVTTRKNKEEIYSYIYNIFLELFNSNDFLYIRNLKKLRMKNILNKEFVLLDVVTEDLEKEINWILERVLNKNFWNEAKLIYYSNINIIYVSTKKINKNGVINFDFKDVKEVNLFFELINKNIEEFLKYLIYLAINNFEKIENYYNLDEYDYRSKFVEFLLRYHLEKNISINKKKIYKLYLLYCQLYNFNPVSKEKFYKFFNMKYKKFYYEKNQKHIIKEL